MEIDASQADEPAGYAGRCIESNEIMFTLVAIYQLFPSTKPCKKCQFLSSFNEYSLNGRKYMGHFTSTTENSVRLWNRNLAVKIDYESFLGGNLEPQESRDRQSMRNWKDKTEWSVFLIVDYEGWRALGNICNCDIFCRTAKFSEVRFSPRATMFFSTRVELAQISRPQLINRISSRVVAGCLRTCSCRGAEYLVWI